MHASLATPLRYSCRSSGWWREVVMAAGSVPGRHSGRLPVFRQTLRRPVAKLAAACLVAGLAAVAPPRDTAMAGPGPAPTTEQGSQPKPAPLPVGELADRRTRTSKTVRAASGKLTTSVYPQPIHYRDAGGRWQPIDTRLSASRAGGYGWASLANDFQTRFKDVLGADHLRVEAAGTAYTLSMVGAARTAAQ